MPGSNWITFAEEEAKKSKAYRKFFNSMRSRKSTIINYAFCFDKFMNFLVNTHEITEKNDYDKLLELDANKQTRAEKTEELKSQYDKLLKETIEDVRVITNTDTLTDQEIKEAILYIVYETIKDEKIKLLRDDNSASRLDVDFLNFFGIQTAQAACPTTTIPTFKQLTLDIDGGTYDNNHYFNGDNGLYEVERVEIPSTCETTFILNFHDEDHPTADLFYDGLRIAMYQRIHDVEPLTIGNNNHIVFDNTWSSSNDFDCVTSGWLPLGCHNGAVKTYTPGQTVYVSNTWNHMMDTSNTNPNSYELVSVP